MRLSTWAAITAKSLLAGGLVAVALWELLQHDEQTLAVLVGGLVSCLFAGGLGYRAGVRGRGWGPAARELDDGR